VADCVYVHVLPSIT